MNGAGAGPNAFLVGAAKAGTTALATHLAGHPAIFVPETKEPNYHVVRHGPLSNRGPGSGDVIDFLLHRFNVADARSYAELYRPGGTASIRVDASVRYLYHAEAIHSLAVEHPRAPIIVVLRDAAERAVSHWQMMRQFVLEPLDLPDALAAEDDRVAAGWGWDWHYRRVGTYAPQLERLFRSFPREQVLVLFYGDLVRDPRSTVAACLAHVGVATTHAFTPLPRLKVASEPRSPQLHRALTHPTKVRRLLRGVPGGPRAVEKLVAANSRPAERVASSQIEGLRHAFADDRTATADLLQMRTEELDERCRGRSLRGSGPERSLT